MGDALLNLTRQLCEFICALSPEQLGEANRTDLRYKTLDWLGCVIAAQNGDAAKRIKGYTLACGGRAQATAFGLPEKTSVGAAAFCNGILSHALEYDDTNKIAITHPGAPVVSAAWAEAEALDVSFGWYALGVAAGYEAMIRMGGAVNPDHYVYWHTTGTCGTFAAAAACAKIMNLPPEQTETAMGIAATTASGLVCVFGTEAKLVTVGNAARNGAAAAELAGNWRFTAPEDAFAAERGFAHAARSKDDLSFMVPKAGDPLMMEDAYYKIHASCGHTHCALDALEQLMRENDFRAEDVEHIDAEVYKTAWELCSAYNVSTNLKAKFSLPYCIAVMLLHGHVTLSEFTEECLNSSEAAELAKHITVREEPAFTAVYPANRPEKVTVTLRDGRRLEKTVNLPEGRPPHSVIENKFMSLAEMTLSANQAAAVMENVLGAKDETRIRDLTDPIRTMLGRL